MLSPRWVPDTQTLPSRSTLMVCSRGQPGTYPGPPQLRSRLPSWSNSSTDGPAMQQSVRGGLVDAPFSSGRMPVERLNTHTWSFRSTASVGTCCMIHLFGSGFGQNGSTRYIGGACARDSGPASSIQAVHTTIITARIFLSLVSIERPRRRWDCIRHQAPASFGAATRGDLPRGITSRGREIPSGSPRLSFTFRSEERRVGKECRSRWTTDV